MKRDYDLHMRTKKYKDTYGDLVYWRRNAGKKVQSVWLGPGIRRTLCTLFGPAGSKNLASRQAQALYLASASEVDPRSSSSSPIGVCPKVRLPSLTQK